MLLIVSLTIFRCFRKERNELWRERYILFGFILCSGFCYVALALPQPVNYMHDNLYRNNGSLHCAGVTFGSEVDGYRYNGYIVTYPSIWVHVSHSLFNLGGPWHRSHRASRPDPLSCHRPQGPCPEPPPSVAGPSFSRTVWSRWVSRWRPRFRPRFPSP